MSLAEPKFLRREKQQVWIYWDDLTLEEKRYTIKRNLEEPHALKGALAQGGAHITSVEAAEQLNKTFQVTRMESLVAEAAKQKGRWGVTWNELPLLTGLKSRSISPRFKPLRHKCLLGFGLEDKEPESPNGQQPQKGIEIDCSDW